MDQHLCPRIFVAQISIKCKTNQYKVFQMWQHINPYKPDNFCIYIFFFFSILERKQITLTVGNQLAYKKIYNVVGYLKGKHNPGLNWCWHFLFSCLCSHQDKRRGLIKEMYSVKVDWNVFVLFKCAHWACMPQFRTSAAQAFASQTQTVLLHSTAAITNNYLLTIQ